MRPAGWPRTGAISFRTPGPWERRENLSEAPASRRPAAGQDRRPRRNRPTTRVGRQPCTGSCSPPREARRLSFWEPPTPALADGERSPRDGVILLRWQAADSDSGHASAGSTLARTTLITFALRVSLSWRYQWRTLLGVRSLPQSPHVLPHGIEIILVDDACTVPTRK
jgi:hypothetical protein